MGGFFDCMSCSHCTKNRLLSISWKVDNVSDINMGRDNKMNKLMRRVMTCIVSAMCVLALFVPVYADNDVYHDLPMVYLHTGETKEIDLGLEEGDKISSAKLNYDDGVIEVVQNERTVTVTGIKGGQAHGLTAWTENGKCYSVDFSVGSEIQSVTANEYYSKFTLTKRPGEEGPIQYIYPSFQYAPTDSEYIATEGKPEVMDKNIADFSGDSSGINSVILHPISAGTTKVKTVVTDNITGKTYDVYQDVEVLEGDYADSFAPQRISVTIKVGEELDLDAYLRKSYLMPENRQFSDEVISFSQESGGKNIVSLSSNGTVKGLMGGTSEISAKLTNGTRTTVYVTVTTDEKMSIYFDKEETGFQLSESNRHAIAYLLRCTPEYMSSTINQKEVQYTSSDESVFTVEDDSSWQKSIVLKKEGTATLTATYKDLTASMLVHVYKAGTKPTEFSIPETVTIGEGFAYNLTPTYTPAYLKNISYKCEVIKGEDVVGLSYGYTNINADSKLYSSLESDTCVKIAAKKTGTAEVKVAFAHDPSVFKIIKVTVDTSSPKPHFSLKELPNSANEKLLGEADEYKLTYGYEYEFDYSLSTEYSSYKKKINYADQLTKASFLAFNYGGIGMLDGWQRCAVATVPGTYKLTFDDGVTKTFTVSAKPTVDKPAVDTKDVETVAPEKINNAIADTQTAVSKAVSQEQVDSTVMKLTEEKNDWFYEKDENGNSTKKPLSSLESTVYLKSDVKEEEKSLVYDITPTLKIKAVAANDATDVMTVEEEIEINEPITMSLAVGDKFKASKLYITHTKDNGQQYVYEGTQQDGVVTFENPHGFSTFTISEERPDIVNPTPTPTPEVTPTPGTQPTPAPGTTGSATTPSKDNKGTSSSAQTGVKTNLGGFAGIAGIAVIVAGLVIVLKKKYQ